MELEKNTYQEQTQLKTIIKKEMKTKLRKKKKGK